MTDIALPVGAASRGPRRWFITQTVRRYPAASLGASLLVVIIALAVLAPLLWTVDPERVSPIHRLRGPSSEHWFGTDMLGRDVWSRTLYGTRVSVFVGLTVAALSTVLGLAIGLVTGFLKWADAVLMRVMDGLMSIPSILLAIALVALTKPSIQNVIIALTIIETPRVARLVRGTVLTLRDQPFVEAAITVGTTTPLILIRHVLPNTMAPLLVQATYVCGAAMIAEALLSFIGAGTPPNIPSWGNIISEARSFFQIAWWIIVFPGIFLSLTVLAVNLFGDGISAALDPRLARRM